MNQIHFDVFYTANKDSLVAMLMRALKEITTLNQENGDLNESIGNHIEDGVELREELSRADTANEYLNNLVDDLRREYQQQTDRLVAFVVKRPKPFVFNELFGAPTWLLVDDAVCNDKKILAIKHLRAHSNIGLKDAKDCIEALIESRGG